MILSLKLIQNLYFQPYEWGKQKFKYYLTDKLPTSVNNRFHCCEPTPFLQIYLVLNNEIYYNINLCKISITVYGCNKFQPPPLP